MVNSRFWLSLSVSAALLAFNTLSGCGKSSSVEEIIEGDEACSPTNPHGTCKQGQTCANGVCTEDCPASPGNSSSEVPLCSSNSIEGAMTTFANHLNQSSTTVDELSLMVFGTQFVLSPGPGYDVPANLTCHCRLSPDQYLDPTAWSNAVSATSSRFQWHSWQKVYGVLPMYNMASYDEWRKQAGPRSWGSAFAETVDFQYVEPKYGEPNGAVVQANYERIENGVSTAQDYVTGRIPTPIDTVFKWAQGIFCGGDMNPSNWTACLS